MTEFPRVADAEILAARGSRIALDPAKPYAFLIEPEATPDGGVEDVATIFTTNPECSFRCLMCDLWKYTTPRGTGTTSVADQVEWALAQLQSTQHSNPAPHVKIYNAGSFFDTGSISLDDRARIAKEMANRQTLIVECHPKLVDRHVEKFAAALAPTQLQVAMGLETVDPVVLARLNKGMDLGDFERAARRLNDWGVATRAFILLGPPGHRGKEAVHWAQRSIDYAFDLGVECCVVIPVRPGNGTLERLEREGHFARPSLAELETVLAYGLALRAGRVFADVWDIETFFDCAKCSAERAAALRRMNTQQRPTAALDCNCER